MATARRPRQSSRKARRKRTPRIASHEVRARRAPDALPLAAQLLAAIDAEFDRLIAVVMAEVDGVLLARGVRRDGAELHQDAVSVAELMRKLINQLHPITSLRRLFAQIDNNVRHATERQLPQIPIPAVVSNGTRLQEAWVAANTDLIKAAEPIKDVVREVVEPRIAEGVRVEEIRKELQEKLDISKKRAGLIARDQTLKASGQLQEARQRQAGIKRYTWTTSLDERVRDDHERLEGQVFSWDDPPVTNFSEVVRGRPERRGHPGSDFQCFPGSTPVLLADPVQRAFRRWYRGQLTQLVTDTGETLECTPNHPILTASGWQPAHAIDVGDYVFDAGFDRSKLFETDIEQRVPEIADVFNALALLFKLRRHRGITTQFHGDGRVDQQIDVVNVDGVLRPHVEPAQLESARKLRLAASDATAFGLRYADAVLLACGLAATCGVSRLRERLARYFVRLSESAEVGCAASSDVEAVTDDQRADRLARDAEGLGQRLDGCTCLICLEAGALVEQLRVRRSSVGSRRAAPSANSLANKVGGAAQLRGDFDPPQALLSKPLRIVQKSVRVSSGCHVYNLSTACNWYVAHQLIVHNCRCTADPILDDPEFEPDADGGGQP